ncbi:uncharacterized protein [Euphorbia lathyris]|uniref:uncharacterized protein isoform X2 n=1 Tax=Euphorbia lathyris TaxID=212925 RepID=UPI0033140C83
MPKNLLTRWLQIIKLTSLCIMIEHEGVQDIHVYFEEDKTSPLLSFKLPEDNLSSASTIPFSSNPEVTNVRIIGDVKLNEKVTVSGDVIGGTEQASTIQMFITISKNFDVESDLQSISLSQTEKVFLIPSEAVGHYLVAKYTPIDANGNFGDSVYAISDEYVKNSTPKKNVRGKNKNMKVASLKSGEKLDIKFYNNRAVGDNHTCWSRHLGKIIRDGNICPVQVQTWKEMKKEVKNRLWGAVKERFEHENMESYREVTLDHMGYLWTAWRSDMYKKYVIPCKTKVEALKNCPPHMSVKDWTWLVNEKFFTDEFQRISKRNIKNRGKTVMPHRSGSKPYRAIMYDMGGKDGNPPDFPSLFFETRQKDGKLQDQESTKKYDELVKTMQSDPSLSTIEVIDKCFGPQSHNHVFGYGGGIKRKEMTGSKSSYRKLQNQEMTNKYDEIVKTTQSHPSLSTKEIIDKYFGPQSHNRIFRYRGGKKRKQLIGSRSAYEKELEAKIKERDAKIQEKEEENRNLKRRLERIESRLDLMENGDLH